MRITVVANECGERWRGFAASARRGGLERSCAPWPAVLAQTRDLSFEADLIRIESPADDPTVNRQLRGRDDFDVLGAKAWATNVNEALRTTFPEAASQPLTPHPRDVEILLDKRACHRVLETAGVPVAPRLGDQPIRSWEELREAVAEAGWPRVFVKPRFGSSGVGVLAVTLAGRKVRAVGHVEAVRRPKGLILLNRKQPVVIDGEDRVAAVVDELAREDLHVERWLPKIVVSKGAVDMRVVCVEGRPTHLAVRVGPGPVTNLQAAGRRIALRDAIDTFGASVTLALECAERTAAVFPRSLQLGVDVGVLAGGRTAVVFEANAFGDLLYDPVDLNGRQRTTWDAQVEALSGGWLPPQLPDLEAA